MADGALKLYKSESLILKLYLSISNLFRKEHEPS